MSGMAFQITSICIVCLTRCPNASKQTSKLHATGLCEGNSPVTGELQRASNAENVSIWWRHEKSVFIDWPQISKMQCMIWLVALLLNSNQTVTQSWTGGIRTVNVVPDSKVHGANMGPIWDRQDPGGPHVGHMNFAIWDMRHGLQFDDITLLWLSGLNKGWECPSHNGLWTHVTGGNSSVSERPLTVPLHSPNDRQMHFLYYWPFVKGIHKSSVDSPHKGPVTWSSDYFYDEHLKNWWDKWWSWWCLICHDAHVTSLYRSNLEIRQEYKFVIDLFMKTVLSQVLIEYINNQMTSQAKKKWLFSPGSSLWLILVMGILFSKSASNFG